MKSTQYTEKTLEHFRDPRNVGTLEGPNVAVGRVGNPVCGDMMDIYIEVEDDRIKDIKFQTFGCGSAVATSSMITELVMGMQLDDALKVSRGDVADALDGLPPIKMHCSNLAADALHEAIKNWREGVGPEDAKKTPGGTACHPIPAAGGRGRDPEARRVRGQGPLPQARRPQRSSRTSASWCSTPATTRPGWRWTSPSTPAASCS